MQAFSVYEESISDSRAQLQAITIVIGTLQAAKVFGADNYDTLITKAALHGAKLLKKPHQATAVQFASHMWWQSEFPVVHGLDESDIKKVRVASMAAVPTVSHVRLHGIVAPPRWKTNTRVPANGIAHC